MYMISLWKHKAPLFLFHPLPPLQSWSPKQHVTTSPICQIRFKRSPRMTYSQLWVVILFSEPLANGLFAGAHTDGQGSHPNLRTPGFCVTTCKQKLLRNIITPRHQLVTQRSGSLQILARDCTRTLHSCARTRRTEGKKKGEKKGTQSFAGLRLLSVFSR